jgi:asparagine synthase (glutamine-hydrolysing)
MCGIIGILNLVEKSPTQPEALLEMLNSIKHRGPDGFGIYRDKWIGMGSARLSIIDLAGGDQPIGNEDGSLWIVFNGEIFNYIELRPALEIRGHHFSTNSDTEVILHLYEEYGPGCLQYLNGQFALAIWDKRDQSLFLARDRVGVRPLFYSQINNQLVFGSEIKAMMAYPAIAAEIDPQALAEVFTYWSPLSPRTIFKGIFELPPAHFMLVKNGQTRIERYWCLDFSSSQNKITDQEYLEEFENLLVDATRIRLRADVPVGAYLSGGLDSSTTTALIRAYTTNHLDTFSISFSDPSFDESHFQGLMAEQLGTNHHEVFCEYNDIGRVFPDVIWHAEVPILRTAPAPMYLLSELVRKNNFKVVLTGEGADEFLGGYDIFKEMKVRRFWARNPESKLRPNLLFTLYPDINRMSSSGAFLIGFFKRGLLETSSPFYSHSIRWSNTARTKRFFSEPNSDHLDTKNISELISLPPEFSSWPELCQAQYLEIVTFLSPYLLSSQGDRMAMAHSVEGRYPFLDYRVIEFSNKLPVHLKMPVLTEKFILKQLGMKYLPDEIWQRVKRPYRAPIHRSFFDPRPLDYVEDLLSERALARTGYFDPQSVQRLVQKTMNGLELSEVEDMALVGVLSTQLVDKFFIRKESGNHKFSNHVIHIKMIDQLIP